MGHTICLVGVGTHALWPLRPLSSLQQQQVVLTVAMLLPPEIL